MTSKIFCFEQREWDAELRRQNRKYILLVHPNVKNLNFIKLVFMPPYTSSRLQPLDSRSHHSLKSHYRDIFFVKMVSHIHGSNQNFRVTLLDAANFIHVVWQNVSAQTI